MDEILIEVGDVAVEYPAITQMIQVDSDEGVIEIYSGTQIVPEIVGFKVGPKGDEGPPGDFTPEMEAARDATILAANEGKTYRDQAATNASTASSAATTATTAKNEAQISRNASANSAINAANSASSANQARDDAQSAKGASEAARDQSVTAKAAAEAARDAAQTAKTGAETAKSGADTAKAGADDAKTAALNAQTAAEDAKTLAEGARDVAAAKAQESAQSASDALASRNAAASSADAASDAAVAAAGSADDALALKNATDISAGVVATDRQAVETALADTNTARDAAQTAQSVAETARDQSQAARDASQTAQTASEAARDVSVQAKTDAQTAQAAAEGARDTAQTLVNDANADLFVRRANNGSDFADPNQVRVTIGAAPLNSPALAGTPTAPTAALGTNTDQVATTAYVRIAIDDLKTGAPALYDTLAEIGTWLQNNDTEIASAISFKLDASAYTAADVLAKVKTVDGPGSGLEADLLDGYHASNLFRDDADFTTTGNFTVRNAAPSVRIGNIGNANEWLITVDADGLFKLNYGTTGSWTNALKADADGTLTAPRLRLTSSYDVTETSAFHALQIGPDTGGNVRVDANELMALNNGVLSDYAIRTSSLGIYGSTTIYGSATVTGEIQSTSFNFIRAAAGNYGLIGRVDGTSFNFLITASGDQYGGWNSLRPFTIDFATGAVYISTGLTLTSNGEALRIIATDNTSDPYLTFWKASARQGYIQHRDGTGSSNGLRIWNDVAGVGLIMSNDGELWFAGDRVLTPREFADQAIGSTGMLTWAWNCFTSTAMQEGEVVSGTNIKSNGTASGGGNGNLGGSWRCLGYTPAQTRGLFQRI
ncbi:hypothetical protein EV128_12514 [Rhizobium azibense]|nr:hypothetical protein EV128_12514 [Rhizobium azibense]